MKRWYVLLALLLPGTAVGQALDAEQLVREIETQYQGQTSHGVATMKIVTADWNRELRLELWGQDRDRFLARILEPKKEAGITTLKVDEQIWNYLPKIDRVMKVPSALMGDGWMGSHYTNDDLVKEAKIDQLYDFSVGFQGETTAVIIARPKPEAAVVWGKLMYVADYRKRIPLRVDYFDEDGELVRRMTFDRVEPVNGRLIPLLSRIEPVDDPGEYTEFVYETLEMGISLPGDIFTLRSLRGR